MALGVWEEIQRFESQAMTPKYSTRKKLGVKLYSTFVHLFLTICGSNLVVAQDGQTQDSAPVTTTAEAPDSNWSIRVSGGQTFISCMPMDFDDSTLTVLSWNNTIKLPIDSVNIVYRRMGTQFWADAAIGAGIGLLVGTMMGLAIGGSSMSGYDDIMNGALFGVFVGFAVGGGIGNASGGDEIYNMRGKSRLQKLSIIRDVMFKHQQEKVPSAKIFERYIQNRVFLPITIVEMPPLSPVHGESNRFHRPSKKVAPFSFTG